MFDKKRILHVGLIGPLPPPYGGMANQLNQLYELLKKENISVSLIQTNSPYAFKWVAQIKGLRALFRLLPYLINVWKLAGRVDVIHMLANSGWSWQLFAAPVIWLSWIRKTPVIINYRGGEARDYLSKSIKWVRPSLNKAAALVVSSCYLQQVFSDFGINAQVIPNIIDLTRFNGKKINHSEALSRQAHLIVTRNLEAIYGIQTAIEAVAVLQKTVPGIKLSIAGSGPQKETLEALIAQHRLENNVYLTGKLNPDEMAELYRSADIMLNPTTVDNMPNSVIEALASGVAVVTTNVGGIPFIVEDNKSALFTPVNNPDEMAKQIQRLLNDRDLYQSLINNGLIEAQKYTWAKVGNSWLNLYRSLAS